MTTTEELPVAIGRLEKRYVIYEDTLGIYLGPTDEWSSDKQTLYSTATTFAAEELAEIEIESLKLNNPQKYNGRKFDIRYVCTVRTDKRATKDNCADAGLPRW
jgi:hypothetical protein